MFSLETKIVCDTANFATFFCVTTNWVGWIFVLNVIATHFSHLLVFVDDKNWIPSQKMMYQHKHGMGRNFFQRVKRNNSFFVEEMRSDNIHRQTREAYATIEAEATRAREWSHTRSLWSKQRERGGHKRGWNRKSVGWARPWFEDEKIHHNQGCFTAVQFIWFGTDAEDDCTVWTASGSGKNRMMQNVRKTHRRQIQNKTKYATK